MSNIQKVPNDTIDLSYLAPAFDSVLSTLYPIAYVYGPDNAAVSGSPFTLDHVGNNLYVKNGAFQAAVDSGTYKVVYEFYEDAGHTIKSSQFGQAHDTITISIPYSSGLGASKGGDFIYDDSLLRKAVEELSKRLLKEFKALKKDFDNGLKVEIPEIKAPDVDTSKFDSALSELKSMISNVNPESKQIIELVKQSQSINKNWFKNVIDGLKRNRSLIIKSKFDKKMMLPILESVADTDIKIESRFTELKKDLTATIDMRNGMAEKNTIKIMEGVVNVFSDVVNSLNDSVRKKLKFAVDELKVLVIRGKVQKQDIKITLQKED